MHVLEEQHERPLARELVEDRHQFALEALLRVPAHLDLAPLRNLRVPRRPDRLQQPRDGLAAGPVEQTVERLQEREVGFGAGEPIRTPATSDIGGRPIGADIGQDVLHQRRLPNPRLTRDLDDHATSAHGIVIGAPQFGGLPAPADGRGRRNPSRSPARPTRLI